MSQRNQMLVSMSDVFAALWRSPFAVPQDRGSKEARAWVVVLLELEARSGTPTPRINQTNEIAGPVAHFASRGPSPMALR